MLYEEERDDVLTGDGYKKNDKRSFCLRLWRIDKKLLLNILLYELYFHSLTLTLILNLSL